MKIKSPARKSKWVWHRWFAWYPVRVPDSRYVDGYWIWLEHIWRKVDSGYDWINHEYSLHYPEALDD